MRASKLDNKRIPCPNAQLIAAGRGAAKRGDLILYQHGEGQQRLGRVLGRISSVNDGLEPVNGFACVMELSSDGSFAYERWIDPRDIMRVMDSPSVMAELFFRPKLPNVESLRHAMEQGGMSDRYVAKYFPAGPDDERRGAYINGVWNPKAI